MKSSVPLYLLLAFLAAAFFLSQCSGKQADSSAQHSEENQHEEVELAGYMTSLQHYTHKFALSVDAENTELAEFYLHEIEELSEEIKEKVPEYEGYQIATLTGSYLDPMLEPVDRAVEASNWKEARAQVQKMIQQCNACHTATDHGFVKVTAGFDKNPYPQEFTPSSN